MSVIGLSTPHMPVEAPVTGSSSSLSDNLVVASNVPTEPTVIIKKPIYTVNCEQYRELFSQYDWDVDIMLAIAHAESGCNPTKHNWKDKHKTCIGSWNILNVGCVHYKEGEDINDINLNLAKAYAIYKKKGTYTDWSTFTSGAYLSYM